MESPFAMHTPTKTPRKYLPLLAGGLSALGLLAGAAAIWPLVRHPPADVANTGHRAESSPGAAALGQVRAPHHPPSTEGYVGARVCGECHAAIAESYARHPMALSFGEVLLVEAIEDYEQNTSFSPPGAQQYRVVRTPAGVWHHEILLGPDREVVYDQAVQVHYAVGSGRRGRSYFIDRDGFFTMSPITWYTGGMRWDLSPGYVPGQHPRFERRVADDCVSCHAGRAHFDRERPRRFLTPRFHETGIGCERCHGPGEAHVAAHRSGALPPELDPIVNPARLPPRLRESVCNQCHVHGWRVPRYGLCDYDFRPGNDLSDVWTVFVEPPQVFEGGTRAVSQVGQMHQSACYQQSGGRFGCISCHDPHQVPQPQHRAAYYRRKCQACHGESDPECLLPFAERQASLAGDSCIECHMPTLAAHDVPHTSQTDHRVLRRPEAALPAETSRTALPVVFDEADARTPPAEFQRARGILLAQLAGLRNDPSLAYAALQELLPVWHRDSRDIELVESIATAFFIQGRDSEAREFWERVLQIRPDREPALEQLAILCHRTGDLQAGVAYLDRLIVLNPWKFEAFGRRAHMLGQLGRMDAAVASAERGLELNPAAWPIHGWLAEVYAQRGDIQRRQSHQRLFDLLAPQGR